MLSQSPLRSAPRPALQPTPNLEAIPNPSGAPNVAAHRSPSPALPKALPSLKTSQSHTDAAVEEYKMFITLVFGVSIFGASTFAVAIGQMTDPADIWQPNKPPITMQTVRTYLGAAWLCFVLAIAVAGFSSSFLTLLRNQASRVEKEEEQEHRKRWGTIATAASAILWTLLVMAFLFLALAMVPYAYVPGWVAVASTILFGLYVVWLTFLQVR